MSKLKPARSQTPSATCPHTYRPDWSESRRFRYAHCVRTSIAFAFVRGSGLFLPTPQCVGMNTFPCFFAFASTARALLAWLSYLSTQYVHS